MKRSPESGQEWLLAKSSASWADSSEEAVVEEILESLRAESDLAAQLAEGNKEFLQAIRVVTAVKTTSSAQVEEIDNVATRLGNNVLRMDYVEYLERGYQIGSGAMESMHRSGSQCRTKLPGARWLKETSQAVFNIRMMQLVGKWAEFWGRADLMSELTAAFSSPEAPVAEPSQAAQLRAA